MTDGHEHGEPLELTDEQMATQAGWSFRALIEAGLMPEIVRQVEVFDRNPENRLIMRLARSAGLPFSEASQRWAAVEDIVAEVAWDFYTAGVELRKCPKCGIDPNDLLDVTDGTYRPLDHGRWKIYRSGCYMCQHLALAEDGLTDKARKATGAHIRIMPRGDDDPFMDVGTT